MIDILGGNDFIFGSGGTVGLYEEGELYTRAGNDNLLGFAGSAGIVNGGTTGTIDTGECIDDIVASGSYVGLYSDGAVWASAGHDSLDGIGIAGYGIEYWGALDTGAGDDTITANGGTDGIRNYGTIVTGSGHDLIDALSGGFGGTGAVAMGNGNDTLMGFGTGSFSGGGGNRDRLLLGDDGIYTVIMSSGVGTVTLGPPPPHPPPSPSAGGWPPPSCDFPGRMVPRGTRLGGGK